MKLINTMRGLDITLFCLTTIPVMLIFLVYCFFYFRCIDKPLRRKDPDFMKHGLSRFIVGAIFFLFGLILFDEIIEFISAYAVELRNTYGFAATDRSIVFNITDSVLFQSICKVYREMPIVVVINGQIFCTALYTGAEGAIASLKTLQVDNNLAIELPANKRSRLSSMFIVWCYLAIISTIYKTIIGSETINFYTSNIYMGCIITLALLILAERSPSILSERKSSKKAKVVDASNVVDTFKSMNEDPFAESDANKFGEHCNVEDLNKHFDDVETETTTSCPEDI